MWVWIIIGVSLGLIAIGFGIWLGRRARIRRREAWQRFARKNDYRWDAERDEITGEVAGVPFQIRAFSEVDDDGEMVSYTQVTFDAGIVLSDIGDSRTPLELGAERTGWTRPGRARRTRVLRREVEQIERQLSGHEQPGAFD